MAILDILEFPDPRLRTHAEPVVEFDAALSQLVDDMFETMYDAPGIGLAATQVDVHKRVIVIDVSEARDQPLVFINPEVEVLDEELESPRVTATEKPSPWSPRACWLSAYSTRSITSTASCSWTTCHR